jgi:phospholipid/cholesterol/gamma-HCH transport system permease protein
MMKALALIVDNALLREYRGYVTLFLYALGRSSLMMTLPYSIAFLRQFNACILQGIGVLTLRATGLGIIVVAYVLTVLAADSGAAMQILAVIIFREGGAMLAAVVLLLKVGTENTTRLSVLWHSGEASYLDSLGVSAYDYLVVPRILASICAAVMLTLYFQLLAALGAIFGSPFFIDTTFDQLFEQLAGQFDLADFGYTLIKSLVFGAIIGTVSCYHGSLAADVRREDLRSPLSRSLLRSFFFMTLFNALFAYLFYGVLLFGLIRTPV